MNIYHIRDWKIIGLKQYELVLREPRFWEILFKTVIWTVVNVVFHVGIGVFLAVLLDQKFVRGKSLWRVLLILPWALPQYITALTWRGMFNYEDVDGASEWQKFWHITAPMLKPVMLPAITLGVVWTFNNINVVWLVSNGGEPNDQTHILVSFVYKAAFTMYRFGWAAALSMIIFFILYTFAEVFLKKTQATEGVIS